MPTTITPNPHRDLTNDSPAARHFQLTAEVTPNPNSLKFVSNIKIVDEPMAFTSVSESLHSPLAQKLFGFPWVAGVFVGQDFITVSKQDWVDWDVLTAPLTSLLEEHLNDDLGIYSNEAANKTVEIEESSDPVVRQIIDILDRDIRPAVALDGGDIVFHKYEDKIVYLQMKGSCSGCPSSTYTLKMGIEARLKEVLPEIREVVSV